MTLRAWAMAIAGMEKKERDILKKKCSSEYEISII